MKKACSPFNFSSDVPVCGSLRFGLALGTNWKAQGQGDREDGSKVSCSLDHFSWVGEECLWEARRIGGGNGICPEITTQGPSAMAKVVLSSILGAGALTGDLVQGQQLRPCPSEGGQDAPGP
ncbi:hypothetical protein U0070_024549 [Myodes glareolus]|uniref:Uncharacterized protein n=1 Tax=Myodes glareolus TaxID=447135 RepID=A0AAW0I313_MYOGA